MTADTLLLTIPNQLGVEYNAHAIEGMLEVLMTVKLHPEGAIDTAPSAAPSASQ
jgi:hypothetical protein